MQRVGLPLSNPGFPTGFPYQAGMVSSSLHALPRDEPQINVLEVALNYLGPW